MKVAGAKLIREATMRQLIGSLGLILWIFIGCVGPDLGRASEGQQAGVPLPKSRVRVKAVSFAHRVIGILERVTSDTLVVLREGEAGRLAIPIVDVTSLEVSRGKHSNLLKGMGIGLLAGAGVGLLVGLATYDDENCFPICGVGNYTAGSTIVFGGLGLVAGFAVGVATHSERWRAVSPSEFKVGFGGLPGGGMAVRVQHAIP
jgi:hypothetical protein